MSIPQDVSLLGNIETEGNRFLDIRLFGVRVKPQILGYETAKALINLLEGKEIEMGKFLEAEPQEGESCDRVVRIGQDRALT
jgi:DNA-binding LacI/PurR family transcriptional regulator